MKFDSAIYDKNGAEILGVGSGTNIPCVTDTGVADAYVAALSPAPTSYTDGMVVFLKITHSNTLTNPTLRLNSLTAKIISHVTGSALVVSELSAGCTYLIMYNSSMNSFTILGGSNDALTISGKTLAFLLSRANQTGTQLAATISDLASAILAQVLTGLDTNPTADILATDTVLSALGKLQGQSDNYRMQINSLENDYVSKSAYAFSAFIDFLYLSASLLMPWFGAAISSGVAALVAGLPNHIGVWSITSSTTANSGYYVMTGVNSFLLAGGEHSEYVFKTGSSFVGTTMRMGFLNTLTSTAPTNGIYAQIVAGVLTGKSTCNSVTSSTASTYTLSASTWYRVVVDFGMSGTVATFSLYDEFYDLLWTDTITSNFPLVTGRETGNGLVWTNSGTTALLLGWIDYMSANITNRSLIR